MAYDNVLGLVGARRLRLPTSFLFLLLILGRPSYAAPQEPPAVPLATDQTNVTLSDKFFTQSAFGLKANGDVFFGATGSVLYSWNAATGTRTRLLQVNDPIPGYPGSVAVSVASPRQLNAAGHLAMINTWAAPGVRNPGGVFVYDGSQYTKIALTGEAVPGVAGAAFSSFTGVRTNAADQVAFVAEFDPPGEVMRGVFLGSPSGPPVKIATTGDLQPLLDDNDVDNIYLIGVDGAGNVAFLCEDALEPWAYAVVIGSPSGTLSVIQSGDSAPGTTGRFGLSPYTGQYAFNANGDLAFSSDVWDDPGVYGGIWVRSASGTVQKLVVTGEATGTSLGGTYSYFWLRSGFNDSGEVLYTAGLNGATSGLALFLKSVGNSPDVLCYADQTLSGGSQAIDGVAVAVLNGNGKAVVIADLKNPSGRALLLCSASASPDVVVVEGSATPAGGTYAQIGAARINDSDQIVFRSDILTLGAVGLFLWTSGSGVQTIVTTAETLTPGANNVMIDFVTASDDEAVFWSYAAAGKDTIFTRSVHPDDGTIRRVIGDGDAAPGGGTIAYINFPAINDNEELVVASSIIGGPVYPADALWLAKPGASLQKLVMTGESAPGSAGGQFSGFPSQARINGNGEVAFYASLTNATGGSNAGVFLVTASGTVQKIARVGESSPVGGTFVSFGTTVFLSDAGEVGFRATSQNGIYQTDGLFVGTAAAAPVKLMAVGDSWNSYTFSQLGNVFKMNAAGQVAFWADLSPQSSGGIFVASAGSAPAEIALSDDNTPIPGTFLILNLPDASLDINSSGQVAFWGVYFTDTGYGAGYFVGSAGAAPVARLSQGQALPGGGTCPLFVPKANGLALSDAGELAMYVPSVSDAPDLPRYVIAAADGTLRAFAGVGDSAVGTGSVFGRLGSVGVNSAGTFFLNATLVDGPAKQGLFRSGLTVLSLPGGADFNGDGKSDILWRHATGGDVWLWPMDGPTKTAETFVRTVGDTDWEIRSVADFTGDGKADVLWRHKTTGMIYLWPMDGSTVLAETYVSTVDPAYDIVGAGDFDGDGNADILWRHTTLGDVWIWTMDGATPLGQLYVGTVDPAYVIKDVGDLDGDRHADLVWHHGTLGEVWVWRMDGATPLAETWVATVPDVGYEIVGVADHSGDGKADILWRHASRGEVWLWTMAGSTRQAETFVGIVPNTNYRILGTGDYDGDGKADILWHHATLGEVWVWRMDGATCLSQTWVGTVMDVGYRPVIMR
jgi:hypothetical protein